MSYFGWLDGDDSQRNAMLEVVKLFEDASTIDELGIGSVRDTFSNVFFPGTSTLHTRVKYLLFVPWLVNDVARHRWPVDRALAELRSRESKLIDALLTGGMQEGVIGRDAKGTLKRMPSELYWPALEHLGIRQWNKSIAGYFRDARQHPQGADDPDLEHPGREPLGMHALPNMPEVILEATTFALSADEAEYLRARIAASTDGSLFAWLAVHHPASAAPHIWEHEARSEFPPDIAQLVDDARRVHHTATGPAILYNLMLARLTGSEEAEKQFTDLLAEWHGELLAAEVFAEWDRTAFWQRLLRLNPRIRPATREFLDAWWDLAARGGHHSNAAHDLIRQRELRLKRTRARLTYPEARATWGVGAGTGRLEFRWGIARRHLNDIADGMAS